MCHTSNTYNGSRTWIVKCLNKLFFSNLFDPLKLVLTLFADNPIHLDSILGWVVELKINSFNIFNVSPCNALNSNNLICTLFSELKTSQAMAIFLFLYDLINQ